MLSFYVLMNHFPFLPFRSLIPLNFVSLNKFCAFYFDNINETQNVCNCKFAYVWPPINPDYQSLSEWERGVEMSSIWTFFNSIVHMCSVGANLPTFPRVCLYIYVYDPWKNLWHVNHHVHETIHALYMYRILQNLFLSHRVIIIVCVCLSSIICTYSSE